MIDVRADSEAELRTGGNGKDARREGNGAVNIATDIISENRGDGIVRIVVRPLANVLPVGIRDAIVD